MVNREKQIYDYLDKNYHIKEDKFFTKHDNIHEWGTNIVDSISIIFNFDERFCLARFNAWAYENGLNLEQLNMALSPCKLKTFWSPEMAQDLQAYGVEKAEENLILAISEELSRELNSKIFDELKRNTSTFNEFLSLVKCIGYESTTLLDPNHMRPVKYFISMNHNDIINERKNNTFWQDWIRAREQDKEA